MKVLVLNAGSSSLKFTLFNMLEESVLAKGVVERIGSDQPCLEYESSEKGKLEEEIAIRDHTEALSVVCEKLVNREHGALSSLSEVDAVGHRVVHGGEKIRDSVFVDEDVKQAIVDCSSLAPLHNPPNLNGIKACEKTFPGVPNVAVFDTAFHQTMPPSSYMYAVPTELYERDGIRKYGFHGTSHKYVSAAAADFLGEPLSELKLITCHLGNGCSVTAVDGGKVIDTSMGLTPLAGLMMGTRCGDIDPGVVLHLVEEGRSADEINNLLNKQSGLLGVAGIGSNDMRDILAARDEGNENARRAVEMYVHRLVLYIGAYNTILEGADAIVFTGGIGENSVPTRRLVLERLRSLGCYIDDQQNESYGEAVTLTTADSLLKAIVIPTNEELMIARETRRIKGDK